MKPDEAIELILSMKKQGSPPLSEFESLLLIGLIERMKAVVDAAEKAQRYIEANTMSMAEKRRLTLMAETGLFNALTAYREAIK